MSIQQCFRALGAGNVENVLWLLQGLGGVDARLAPRFPGALHHNFSGAQLNANKQNESSDATCI